MEKITNFYYTPLPEDSPYVKPFRMYYVQNGKEKSWDLLKVHDSVAIIILNKTKNTLILVRQFRPGKYSLPMVTVIQCRYQCLYWKSFWNFCFFSSSLIPSAAVYHSIISSVPDYETVDPKILLDKFPVSLAFTNELCAGIVDKSKPLIEIAREEILEECGYSVPIERIEHVLTYR